MDQRTWETVCSPEGPIEWDMTEHANTHRCKHLTMTEIHLIKNGFFKFLLYIIVVVLY